MVGESIRGVVFSLELARCNCCKSSKRWSGRAYAVLYSALSWRPIVSRSARLEADLSASSTGDRDTRSLLGALLRLSINYDQRLVVPNGAQAFDREPGTSPRSTQNSAPSPSRGASRAFTHRRISCALALNLKPQVVAAQVVVVLAA